MKESGKIKTEKRQMGEREWTDNAKELANNDRECTKTDKDWTHKCIH